MLAKVARVNISTVLKWLQLPVTIFTLLYTQSFLCWVFLDTVINQKIPNIIKHLTELEDSDCSGSNTLQQQ